MNLYEISAEIERFEFVTDENGEVLNYDALDSLQMERDTKRENIALLIKNLTAEAEAIKAESKALADRAKAKENQIRRWKNYLAADLAGEKFETAKCKVSYRHSKSLSLADGFIDWAEHNRDDLLRYKKPEPDAEAIKSALKAGEKIIGAELVENVSVIIK